MKLAGLKTYSHFENVKRVPTEYEIGSSLLHYYPNRGLEVETPIGEWVRTQQAESSLKFTDWNSFTDPRATTYASYTTMQNAKVAFVARLNETLDQPMSDAHRTELARAVGCLRFVCHALQMTAAYVGQMSPSSQLTIVCTFQAADEMRRVHQFSYRLALWQEKNAAEQAMHHWLHAQEWQGVRQLMEELLITFDWTESFVALNRVVKVELDRMFSTLAKRAESASQFRFAEMIGSLLEDSAWHDSWSKQMEKVFVQSHPENAAKIEIFKKKWGLKAAAAVNSVIASWTLPEARV